MRRVIIRVDRLHPLTSCLKRNSIMTDKLTSLRQFTTVVADT
ncbi:transaldolase, partial [Salmonella enterica subsp. enterica serovar Agona]|nr:transaldolase [Salmonella enterica]EBW5451089.1 transaldolase [Salmonella enterica subsp. enterica serovar Agona]